MGPAVIAASAVQVNVMVNGRFASGLGDGPTSWLAYAFRLMQLPLGIFGVAVGTVALPAVAKLAAKLDFTGIRSTLGHGVRLAFFLTAPCTVGLIFLAAPIISLIFERGKFGPADTLQTAAALQCYALGLAAYSGIKVIAPAFYALNRRHLPMLVSFLSIVTNYALNYFFTHRLHWGHRGLAFSTSLVAVINFTLLYWMMARHLRGLESRALGAHLGKLLLACVPLAGVCLAAQQAVFADLHTMGLLTKTACVLGTIGAAAAVFAGAALLLKMDEVEAVRGLIRRRLGWG
jgi:putative peptidoglycan lipid II flippase